MNMRKSYYNCTRVSYDTNILDNKVLKLEFTWYVQSHTDPLRLCVQALQIHPQP